MIHKQFLPVVIVPPLIWYIPEIISRLERYLAENGVEFHIILPWGKNSNIAQDETTLEAQTVHVRESIRQLGYPPGGILLLGLSTGCIICRNLTKQFPDQYINLALVSCPGVVTTSRFLFKTFANQQEYWRAISGEGNIHLTENDIQRVLYAGDKPSMAIIKKLNSLPISASIIRDAWIGYQIKPIKNRRMRLWLIGASRQLFDSRKGREHWINKCECETATYIEVNGSHYGIYNQIQFAEMVMYIASEHKPITMLN